MGWSPDLPGGRCRQGRKGIGREALKRRASETIGRKDEAANKTEPLQDLFSLFNFQSEISRFHYFVKLRTQKATFSNLLGRRSNITTDGRAIEPPRLAHRLGMFSDLHIFTGPEPTSN